MFTGIIQALGRLQSVEGISGDCRLWIDCGKLGVDAVNAGDSIAVDGVCLTAIETRGQCFAADVSRETLSRTTLRQSACGSAVNLELALTPAGRMGGHFVSGHVDGTGKVSSRQEDARSFRFTIKAPRNLGKYIAEKGSICVDGVSLTVNQIDGSNFNVNIVPHTMAETTFGLYKVGQSVNLEVDLLARYLERLIQGEDGAVENPGVTCEFLDRSGFSQ